MIFFLNSTNRVYNDRELNKVPGILFSDGVFNTIAASLSAWLESGDFLVEAPGGSMNITAKPGAASTTVLSEGESQRIVISEANQLSAAVAANAGLAYRNDAVVLRVLQSVITNDTLNAAGSNAVVLTVISGSSATALTDSEVSIALGGDPFVRLANVLVPFGATEITSEMITDVRSLVSMSRAVKLAADVLRAYPTTTDPTGLQQGDIWYNSDEGILKMFDGERTIALQSQDFDWGYYPPGGIDSIAKDFEPVAENDGSVSVSTEMVYALTNAAGAGAATRFVGQLFKMPSISNPYIRVKLGNPDYAAGIIFKVYSINGSNQPNTLIETVGSFAPADTPKNDYVDLYLDGSLYTPGTKYMLVAQAYNTGFYNAGAESFVEGAVQVSTQEADEVFFGRRSASGSSLWTNPLSATWPTTATADVQFVMTIAERGDIAIGQTDVSGHAYRAAQSFVARSKDIIGFLLAKGADEGTPTGDITATLYVADDDGLPSGDALASGVIAEADWTGASLGDLMEFPINYDDLTVGERYVVLVETDDHDDDNYYTLLYGVKTGGYGKTYNTAEGWETLGGDFFWSVRTSSISKIVITNPQGIIPEALIPYLPRRVETVVSSATPSYNTDLIDALSITALGEAITSMTTNKLGTPHDFQRLIVRIKDDGTSRNITWGADFVAKGVALPTATTLGKRHTITLEYDSVISKWCCIAAVVEA